MSTYLTGGKKAIWNEIGVFTRKKKSCSSREKKKLWKSKTIRQDDRWLRSNKLKKSFTVRDLWSVNFTNRKSDREPFIGIEMRISPLSGWIEYNIKKQENKKHLFTFHILFSPIPYADCKYISKYRTYWNTFPGGKYIIRLLRKYVFGNSRRSLKYNAFFFF